MAKELYSVVNPIEIGLTIENEEKLSDCFIVKEGEYLPSGNFSYQYVFGPTSHDSCIQWMKENCNNNLIDNIPPLGENEF